MKTTLHLPDSKFYRLSKYLPDSIRQLLRLIDNPKQIQQLINKFGGSEIQIPIKYNDDTNFLSGALNKTSALIIIEAYAGTKLYIPKCSAFIRRIMRDVLLIADYDALIDSSYSVRQSVTVVRLKYGLTERRVRQIVAKKNSLKS